MKRYSPRSSMSGQRMSLAAPAALLRELDVDRSPSVPDLVQSRFLDQLYEVVLHRLDDTLLPVHAGMGLPRRAHHGVGARCFPRPRG